jgi:hypothetical protein
MGRQRLYGDIHGRTGAKLTLLFVLTFFDILGIDRHTTEGRVPGHLSLAQVFCHALQR